MLWIDYKVEQIGNNFTILGDWPGEVMGIQKDGTPKENWLYKPGDVFIVNEHGVLVKSDAVNALLLKHESAKIETEL